MAATYDGRVPRAIVHIGTHKTGTTTFQRWAHANRGELQAATGVRFYRSMFATGLATRSHFELALVAMRPERWFVGRNIIPEWETPDFGARLEAHLRAELDGEDLIISSEDLSLLRHPDEVATLRELLAGYDLEFIAVRRDPVEFLRSYRAWMSYNALEPSDDPTSVLHATPDSWILDFEALDPLYPGLQWIGYEDAMDRHGSIIPALIEGMGLETAGLPDWRVPPLNVSNGKLRRSINRLRWRLRR